MAINSSGSVNTALAQNRRRISTSSGFSSAVRVTVRGSRAIPQIGHDAGASLTISGCIGQVYATLCCGGAMVSGSKAIPHLGHEPNSACRTSGCIGQMYSELRAVAGGLLKGLLRD